VRGLVGSARKGSFAEPPFVREAKALVRRVEERVDRAARDRADGDPGRGQQLILLRLDRRGPLGVEMELGARGRRAGAEQSAGAEQRKVRAAGGLRRLLSGEWIRKSEKNEDESQNRREQSSPLALPFSSPG
jgi:hypothetical protein